MKTVRRLLFGDVLASVGMVTLSFLSLFFFLDLVEELRNIGRNGYTVLGALGYCLLELPGHLYQLAPIVVLIGSIYALSRLAQSSEFTILRTSGLGPGRALALLAQVGLVFAVLTFLVGDVIAPLSERLGAQVQATQSGGYGLGSAGAWLKERRQTPDGPRSISVNVRAAQGDGLLRDVRIFEFDAQGRLLQRWTAETARVDAQNARWDLSGVTLTEWPKAAAPNPATTTAPTAPPGTSKPAPQAAAPAGEPAITTRQLEQAVWPTTLQASVVSAAVMPESTMSTLELQRYVSHLARNEQASQSHEIAFWRRALYPFACVVMVALALPFAYLHARAGGISLKVFGGIMLGISFVLMNNVAGHLGLLRNWTPWIVAATPSLVYLGLSMLAFTWLVRVR
jgi:lipopolysaccharide export system permease protein